MVSRIDLVLQGIGISPNGLEYESTIDPYACRISELITVIERIYLKYDIERIAEIASSVNSDV